MAKPFNPLTESKPKPPEPDNSARPPYDPMEPEGEPLPEPLEEQAPKPQQLTPADLKQNPHDLLDEEDDDGTIE